MKTPAPGSRLTEESGGEPASRPVQCSSTSTGTRVLTRKFILLPGLPRYAPSGSPLSLPLPTVSPISHLPSL